MQPEFPRQDADDLTKIEEYIKQEKVDYGKLGVKTGGSKKRSNTPFPKPGNKTGPKL